MVIANQAVAVAMAQGPSAGLAMLDRLADDGRLDRWPQLHVARAELLARLGRCEAARDAYQVALAAAELPAAERAFLTGRLADLADGDPSTTGEVRCGYDNNGLSPSSSGGR